MHNPRISNLVAIVFVGCGGAVLTKVEPAASGAGSCHDDRVVPITPSMPYIGHGGAPCSLSEGGTGIVLGAACIDANACRCKPEAGPASCMPGGDINLWPYVLNLNVHCVYELCGGANDGERCALASGAMGVCCASNCTQGMPAGVPEIASCRLPERAAHQSQTVRLAPPPAPPASAVIAPASVQRTTITTVAVAESRAVKERPAARQVASSGACVSEQGTCLEA